MKKNANIDFKENVLFRRKWAKIADNSDHNIDYLFSFLLTPELV
jgi:hypothetical protein